MVDTMARKQRSDAPFIAELEAANFHPVWDRFKKITPLRPQARQAMTVALELCGNPSSVHAEGRQARRLVEEARATIAAALGTTPRNVVFTSGGTEANALALRPGLRRGGLGPAQRLVISAIEHASVLAGGGFPSERIQTAPVTASGLIDLPRLRELLERGPPALVSLMSIPSSV